jgi:TRAP-type C4-dicarboxylate transport system substrate-binding protein
VRRLALAAVRALVLLVAVGWAGRGRAEGPTVRLRLGAVAPEGTGWARALKAFANDVAQATNGAVQMKWVLGGIAGDELESMERVRRGQLDGLAGAMFCERLAPSLKVVRVPGIVRTHAEYRHVITRLRSTIEAEMAREGWVSLGVTTLGEDHILTRRPFRTLDELRGMRIWVWNLDDVLLAYFKEIGVEPAAMPPADAARAFDDGRSDGFVTVPSAALAYQWTLRARNFARAPLGWLPACLVFAQRSFDALSPAHRDAVRTAAAKLTVLVDEQGEQADEQLTGGLLARQGVTMVPVDDKLRAALWAAGDRTAARLRGAALPTALVTAVSGWLAAERQRAAPNH